MRKAALSMLLDMSCNAMQRFFPFISDWTGLAGLS